MNQMYSRYVTQLWYLFCDFASSPLQSTVGKNLKQMKCRFSSTFIKCNKVGKCFDDTEFYVIQVHQKHFECRQKVRFCRIWANHLAYQRQGKRQWSSDFKFNVTFCFENWVQLWPRFFSRHLEDSCKRKKRNDMSPQGRLR
eukprot:18025_4